MPPIVNKDKCNGCEGLAESYCENICPGNLMHVDEATNKSYCRATNECWDCMSCIKVCPRGALETKMPYQLGYFNAKLRPLMGKNTITWVSTDIYGNEKKFKYTNRIVKD